MDELDEVLNREGGWAIRATIYLNGKRIGTCDTSDWKTFLQAAYWLSEGLASCEIELHRPKVRAR